MKAVIMKKSSLIYVVSHQEFLGSAIIRKLKEKGYKNLLLKKLDLLNQEAVEKFFKNWRPEYIFLPSIKTGGILANSAQPADFIYQNTISQTNIIYSAFRHKAKKLLFLGSACSYPKVCPQPIKEEYLLRGLVEPTNESYALSKISGIKMCQAFNKQYKTNFISVIPTNIYGPNDHFDEGGHVIAGLVKKFHQAGKSNKGIVKIWGTGKPKREFLYVDDFADACIFLMNNYEGNEIINIAGAKEISIKQLVDILKKTTGFKGKIIYQTNKPDGMLRRFLDSNKIAALGWFPKISLEQGLKLTYEWYKNHYE